MLTFKDYLIEKVSVPSDINPPMASKGVDADRHANKYLSSQRRASTTYRLHRKVGNLDKNSPITVHDVHKNESGEYHATFSSVHEPEKKYTAPISHIQKPEKRDSRKKETSFVDDLHNQITSSKEPIHMYDRNGVKHRIVGAHQVSGNPKADIALVNDKGEHVIHISHKESQESQQGYGALNSKENISHPTVKDFSDKIKSKIPDERMALKGKSRTMKLSHSNPHHSDLIRKALFGKQHDSEKSGVENVDMISHGRLVLQTNNQGISRIKSDKDITRRNYHSQNYEITAKHATDRTIPGTNIGGIIGVTHAGHRKGKDVTSISEESYVHVF